MTGDLAPRPSLPPPPAPNNGGRLFHRLVIHYGVRVMAFGWNVIYVRSVTLNAEPFLILCDLKSESQCVLHSNSSM